MNILNSILSKIIPSAGSSGAAAARPSPLLPVDANDNARANDVDVNEILRGLEARNPQKLDWRNSIVDLMKLLGMDSSLSSRKQLAEELNYQGDTRDSAAMNEWLHQQVMVKLEENGGKIPGDLKH